MAKRAAADEKPYRPLLDTGLVSAALTKPAVAAVSADRQLSSGASAKIVENPKAEPIRRPEPLSGVIRDGQPSDHREQPRAEPSIDRQPIVEKFDHEKRILFTRPESQAIDRLVNSLATRLNCQV